MLISRLLIRTVVSDVVYAVRAMFGAASACSLLIHYYIGSDLHLAAFSLPQGISALDFVAWQTGQRYSKCEIAVRCGLVILSTLYVNVQTMQR